MDVTTAVSGIVAMAMVPVLVWLFFASITVGLHIVVAVMEIPMLLLGTVSEVIRGDKELPPYMEFK